MKISIVGLGKLGLCLAVCYADTGYDVLGVDIEEQVVDYINRGITSLHETGLSELLIKYGRKQFRATTNHKEAIETTDITIILVATPSNPDGSFSNRYIKSALKSLAIAFKEKKSSHLFIISSTVMPGSINESFISIIEKYSGKKLNRDFGVCYDPDFVALGKVIYDFKNPDLVIIGESSQEWGNLNEEIHQCMCENNPTIKRMSITNAEIAKVCLNAYITTKISFVNSIANLCEQIPGANVDIITTAIGTDRRISPYYFKGGLSFGGTCFPRDISAYIKLCDEYNVQSKIIRAVDCVNDLQDDYLKNIVVRNINEGDVVGILGLAFTPNTPVIVGSPAIKLIQKLIDNNLRIVAYDPLAIPQSKSLLGSSIEYVHSIDSCLNYSDIVVVTLALSEFKQVIESYVPNKQLTIIDCWRIIDSSKLNSQIKYIGLGIGR